MARKDQPLIGLESVVVFVIVAFEPILPINRLLGADETEFGVAERDAIIGVPAAQHRAGHLAGHAADRGAAPDPARRRIADPGLAVGLIHTFHGDAADPI